MSVGAEEFIKFMLAFYNKYPEFKTRDFFITGESYAGKYIPIFANHTLEYNAKNPNSKIPLAACLIGDPFTAPVL